MKNFRRKTSWLHPAILLVLVGAAVHGMTWAGWLESPERVYSDLWHRLAGLRYKPAHVVIVTLDEPTLAEHPEEPLVCWTPYFARVLEVLRGAGAGIMGLDYLYYVSIEDWLKKLDLPPNHPSLKYDAAFKAQLASGRVVMAANLGVDGQQKIKVTLPIQSYFTSLPQRAFDVGLVNFYTDADGVVRRYMPAVSDDYGQVMLTLAKLLATRATGQDPAGEIERLKHDPALKDWSADDPSAVNLGAFPLIGYVGPPYTFPRLSFSRFLGPEAETDPEILNLKGKVVIIAYEPAALQDVHKVRSPETAPALLPQGDRKNLYEPENPQGARYGAPGRKKPGRGTNHGVAEGRAALVIRLGNQ